MWVLAEGQAAHPDHPTLGMACIPFTLRTLFAPPQACSPACMYQRRAWKSLDDRTSLALRGVISDSTPRNAASSYSCRDDKQ